MRRFVLIRDTDVNGVSGEGTVIWGLQFPDGRVAYRWNTVTATSVVADRIQDVLAIHGHDGATRLVWLDTHEQSRAWTRARDLPADPAGAV